MNIKDLNGVNANRVTLSDNSITLKNENGKTCGIIRNAVKMDNHKISSREAFEFSGFCRKIGIKLNPGVMKDFYKIDGEYVYVYKQPTLPAIDEETAENNRCKRELAATVEAAGVVVIRLNEVDENAFKYAEEPAAAETTETTSEQPTAPAACVGVNVKNIISKYTCKPLKNSYSGHGWQGCNYSGIREAKETAADIRKALKRELPDFKFSVTTRNYNSINVYIKSGNVPKYAEGSQTLTAEISEIKKAVQIIVDSYNYDDCDSMSDYFDVGFYDYISLSEYEYIPTAEPKTATAPATSEGENLDGIAYTAEEDTDTRTGEPLTVVKLAERVDRDEYKRIAGIMKAYGGYYSRFKGGFIFKTRPAFLDAEPVTADNTPGGEAEELATVETAAEVQGVEEVEELDTETEGGGVLPGYIDPVTLSDGNKIEVTNTETGVKAAAIFHSFDQSENTIECEVYCTINGDFIHDLPGFTPQVYKLGDRYQITTATTEKFSKELAEILAEAECKLFYASIRSENETLKKAHAQIKNMIEEQAKIIKISPDDDPTDPNGQSPRTTEHTTEDSGKTNIITMSVCGETVTTATDEAAAETLDPATFGDGFEIVEKIGHIDEQTSEEQPQTSGEIIRRGRNIYHTGANAAKVVEDFGQIETGRKYTIIKFDEWVGGVEITYLTAMGVNVRKYAQYENAVEITYKVPRKRHTDKKIMHEEQSYILYDGFVPAIPDSVFFNIEERPGVTTKMSKYSCCDIRNLIDIKKYYAAVGVLPLADTLPNLDDPQPPTDPTPSEPEELPTLSPTPAEPENTAEAENLDPEKGEGGGSQKSEHEKFVELLQKTEPTKAETIKEAAEYYKKALEESGIETWAVIVTANKYSDILTSAEILEAIESTGEDPEPPTDPPQPTKPTEDSEPTEGSPTEAPGEDMPTPSPTSSEENNTAPTSDPEPIGAGELPETEPETVSAVIVHELPKNLIEQANNNSQFNRGDSSARSYAAYCEAVQSWDISDSKKQKILDKVYKKYLPILQNQAAWVPWTVAGPARYNAKKLDKSDRVMQLSAEFSDWFNGIKNGIQSKETTGHDEKTKRIIKNIGDCIANKDSEKIRLDWGGFCRKYLEELAALSQSEFVKWFEESNKAFKFRKSTTIYKLYVKASAGEQITAEKKELFQDENLTAYSDGGRVYIRFFSRPAQQLKFALKKRGYWWNSHRSEWSTYESRYNAEWVQNISTQYEKYI